MNFLDIVSKVGSLLSKPLEIIANYAEEPIRRWEHQRYEQSQDNALHRDIERQTAKARIYSEIQRQDREHQAQLQRQAEREKAALEERRENQFIAGQIAVQRAQAEVAMQMREHEITMRAREREHEMRLHVEKTRLIAEIEEWKKDKQFERMVAVSEAIMRFQTELTQLNLESIQAIGNMQLELREKAQVLVYNKTLEYKKLQDDALQETMKDLEEVERRFAHNEQAKEILMRAVDKRLGHLIDTTNRFLQELNNDIKVINLSISSLTESSQHFIETHLSQFQVSQSHLLGVTAEEFQKLPSTIKTQTLLPKSLTK